MRGASIGRLVALAAAFVAIAAPAAAEPLATVTAKGRLRIAVYSDFAPWSYQDKGKLAGVDVDLGAKLAEALGLRPEFVVATADETVDDDLRNFVWRGTLFGEPVADVMMHVPVDPLFAERNDQVSFGGAYHRDGFAMACVRSADCTRGPTSLDGEPIGVELDSVPDFYLLGSYGGRLRDDLVHYESGLDAVEALKEGKVSAVLATRAQIEYGLVDSKTKFATSGGPFPGMTTSAWPVGLAVKADSRDLGDKLGEAMAQLVDSGEVDRIFAKYGLTRQAPLKP